MIRIFTECFLTYRKGAEQMIFIMLLQIKVTYFEPILTINQLFKHYSEIIEIFKCEMEMGEKSLL